MAAPLLFSNGPHRLRHLILLGILLDPLGIFLGMAERAVRIGHRMPLVQVLVLNPSGVVTPLALGTITALILRVSGELAAHYAPLGLNEARELSSCHIPSARGQ
jgi:hypothetical protein